MSNDKEQQPDDKKRPKERKQRKRGKRAYGTGSIFRRPERKGKQWVAQIETTLRTLVSRPQDKNSTQHLSHVPQCRR